MNKGFNRIFLGFIFLTFHINIETIQILPDFISYLIIYSGISILDGECTNEGFSIAKKLSVISIVIGLLSDYSTIGDFEIGSGAILPLVYMAICQCIQLCLIYFIFEGAIKVFRSKENNEEEERYLRNQKDYTIFSSASSVCVILSSLFYGDLGSIAVIMAIAFTFIVNLSLLSMLHRLGNIY